MCVERRILPCVAGCVKTVVEVDWQEVLSDRMKNVFSRMDSKGVKRHCG